MAQIMLQTSDLKLKKVGKTDRPFRYDLKYDDQRDINDPDNHKCVITHLEPDILECEVKWVLGSITTNKASGSDGIPAELCQILKDDAVKMLHSIC